MVSRPLSSVHRLSSVSVRPSISLSVHIYTYIYNCVHGTFWAGLRAASFFHSLQPLGSPFGPIPDPVWFEPGGKIWVGVRDRLSLKRCYHFVPNRIRLGLKLLSRLRSQSDPLLAGTWGYHFHQGRASFVLKSPRRFGTKW